jgi:hypothetical protein
MTDPLFQKLNTAAQDAVQLSEREKDTMHRALMAHMRTVPLAVRPVPSPYVGMFLKPAAALLIAPLVIILGAGGTAYAAEGSLPGDMLYPVKISVNEKIQTALATSPSAKAKVNVQLAQRRLEEAQALALSGRLNATTTAQIKTNLSEHAELAQTLGQSLAQNDPEQAAEIAAQLSSSLAANDAVLEDLASRAKDDSTRADTKALSAVVRAHLLNVLFGTSGQKGASASTTSSGALTRTATSSAGASTENTNPKAETVVRLGNRATGALAKTLNSFKDAKDSLDPSVASNVGAQLSSIQEMLDAGNTALKAGDNAQAFGDFTEAYSRSLKLQALFSASERLGGKKSLLNSLLSIPQSDLGADAQGSLKGTAGSSTASTTSSVESVHDANQEHEGNKHKQFPHSFLRVSL